MDAFFTILLNLSHDFGYFGIVFLMAVESSFIPFPSELIIPPAAYLASRGEMGLFFIIISGIIGSLIGAVINYALGYYLGRTIIYKLSGKKIAGFLALSPAKIKKTEEFFLKYGILSTFIGRLIPVIRQLISIPAGFAKMSFSNFLLYTAAGSAVWVIILALLGYGFGSNQELLLKYYTDLKYYLYGLGLLIFLLIFWQKRKTKNLTS